MSEVIGRLAVYGPLIAATGLLGFAFLLSRLPTAAVSSKVWSITARVGAGAGLALLGAEVVRVVCQAWSAFGADLTMEQLRTIALESRWGRRWQWQPKAAAVATLGFLLASHPRLRPAGWTLATAGILAVHFALPLTGHAAGSAVDSWAQSAHSLGASLWLGTLTCILAPFPASLLSPGHKQQVEQLLLRSFAPIATTGVVLLLAGAIVLSVRALPSLAAIPTTVWGRWWLLKVGLAGTMMAIGAWNWRRLRVSLDGSDASLPPGQPVRRSARVELLFGLAAVIATASLTSVGQPGMEP